MAKVAIVIEDKDDGEIHVHLNHNADYDILDSDDEDLSAAEHLAKRVVEFIGTIDADEENRH
jgi:hypothetical protein